MTIVVSAKKNKNLKLTLDYGESTWQREQVGYCAGDEYCILENVSFLPFLQLLFHSTESLGVRSFQLASHAK